MKLFKEYKKAKNSVSTPPIKHIEVKYCGENIYTNIDEMTGRKADIIICSMNISKLGTDCLIVDGKNSPNQLIILIDTGLNDDPMINMRTDDNIDGGRLREDIIRRGAGVNVAITKYMRTYYIITNTGELTIDIDEEINPRHLIPIIDWSYQHGFNTWNIHGSISVRTLEEIHKTIDDFVKCRNKRIQLTQ